MMSNTKKVDRKVVSIGLDFRPVPVNLGDGRIWEFNPDPSTEQWARVQAAMDVFNEVEKGKDSSAAVEKISEAHNLLEDAVVGLLIADGEEFREKSYGLFALQRLTVALMETLTGFPTKPQGPSGKPQDHLGPSS